MIPNPADRPVADIYTDGGVCRINPSPHGGSWAYVWVDAAGERIKEASGAVYPIRGFPRISNNVTEFAAVVEGLEGLPDGWSGRVCTDSQVTITRFARLKLSREDWLDWTVPHTPRDLVGRGWRTLHRLGDLRFVLFSGHPTKADLAAGFSLKNGRPVSRHNVRCDELCTLVNHALTGG